MKTIPNKSYHIPKAFYYLAFFILLTAAFILRTYNLNNQGYFFYDEGAMLYRASQLQAIWQQGDLSKNFVPHYVDTKIAWIVTVILFKTSFLANYFTIQYLSVGFAILTILLAFIFAYRYYKSTAIAFLTLTFLSISSYHVFYSRLAMPESMATFLVLASLYCYYIAQCNRPRFVYLSGIIAAIALLTIRSRVFLLPIMILCLEWNCFGGHSEKINTKIWRYVKFLATWTGIILLFELFLMILRRSFFIPFPSYLLALYSDITAYHKITTFEFSHLLVYAFYLLKLEGLFMPILFSLSIFFIKAKHSPWIPFSIVLLQIIFSSLVDEKVARSISVVLPFFSLTCAVTFFNLRNLFNRRFTKIIYYLLFLILIGSSLSISLDVLKFRSEMREATHWIKTNYPHSGIISMSAYNVLLYAPSSKIVTYQINSPQDLIKFYNSGFRTLVIEPQKFIKRDKLENKSFYSDQYFSQRIEQICRPVKVFDHFNKPLLSRFIYEHTKPNFSHLQNILHTINDESGQLKIFDILSCLQQIGKTSHLPSEDTYEPILFHD